MIEKPRKKWTCTDESEEKNRKGGNGRLRYWHDASRMLSGRGMHVWLGEREEVRTAEGHEPLGCDRGGLYMSGLYYESYLVYDYFFRFA